MNDDEEQRKECADVENSGTHTSMKEKGSVKLSVRWMRVVF